MKISALFRWCVAVMPGFLLMSDLLAQPGILKGRIMDEATGRWVDYGQVLNFSRNLTIYSNKNGEFTLEANSGDTLVFSALGYYYRKVIVADSMLNAQVPSDFVLRSQVYELSEAQISALGSYNDFKHKFIYMNRPETKTEKLADQLAEVSHAEARDAFNTAQANRKLDGITFFTIPILSPEERERKKLAAIIQKERRKDLIYSKFNPEVVRKVTGLSDDDDIIEFMVFCGFTDKYLLEVNEADLMMKISARFAAFKKKKKELDQGVNPWILSPDNINTFG